MVAFDAGSCSDARRRWRRGCRGVLGLSGAGRRLSARAWCGGLPARVADEQADDARRRRSTTSATTIATASWGGDGPSATIRSGSVGCAATLAATGGWPSTSVAGVELAISGSASTPRPARCCGCGRARRPRRRRSSKSSVSIAAISVARMRVSARRRPPTAQRCVGRGKVFRRRTRGPAFVRETDVSRSLEPVANAKQRGGYDPRHAALR